MTKVIGLGGALRSGKDEIANHLVKRGSWTVRGMSEPLAIAVYTLNPWIEINPKHSPVVAKYIKQHYNWKERLVARAFYAGAQFARYDDLVDEIGYTEAKIVPNVREFLQLLGTDVGRKMIDENVWVDIAKRSIQADMAEGLSVALTGVRFPNEVEMIKSLDGTNVWVSRPSEVAPATQAGHASESSVSADDFDIVIVNDGTLEELHGKADGLIDD